MELEDYPQSSWRPNQRDYSELVRGISDALTLVRMARTDKPSRRTYEDLASAAAGPQPQAEPDDEPLEKEFTRNE